MDCILREQDGIKMRRDLKILNQRSFIINSQFFMFLQFLSPQVVTNQVKVEVTRLRLNLPTWRRSHTHAQSTNTHLETIDIWCSDAILRLKPPELHNIQTRDLLHQ